MPDSNSKTGALVKLYAPVFLFALVSTILVIALKPIFTQIQYSNLATTISALNAPDKIKHILLFLLHHNVYLLLCGCFGAAVGASEILSRNRDEPFLALKSPPARRYLLVNAGISIAAFFLLDHFKASIMPGVINDPLLASVAAGFGAMIILRARILNFRDDEGSSTGPDSVISNFLTSINLQIARFRASQRQQIVYEESQKIVDPETAPDFLRTFLISYQELSNEDRRLLDGEITRIYESSELKSPRLKFMAVAFGLLNIMGETNFRMLMQQLSNYQQLPNCVTAPSVQPPADQPQSVPPQPPPPSAPYVPGKIDMPGPIVPLDLSGTTIPTPAPAQVNPGRPLIAPPVETLSIPPDDGGQQGSNGKASPPQGPTDQDEPES